MTLVEILLVSGIMAMLIAIAVPNIIAMKERVCRNTCIDNLRQIKAAKEQWALDHSKDYSDTPAAADLNIYIKDGTAGLICPGDASAGFDTSYTIKNIGSDPECIVSPETHHL